MYKVGDRVIYVGIAPGTYYAQLRQAPSLEVVGHTAAGFIRVLNPITNRIARLNPRTVTLVQEDK